MGQLCNYAFVEFAISDDAAFHRLSTVTEELLNKKNDEFVHEDDDWLPYFNESDLSTFWWPSEDQAQQWYQFWLSTPLPERHSPEMPTPPWDFSSMIIAIMDGEYNLVGIRKLSAELARFEIDPHGYPYGGITSIRALVRSFGHEIIGFDDGTGYISGDPQPPRWSAHMLPLKIKPTSS